MVTPRPAAPHVHARNSVRMAMRDVLLGLLPGTLLACWLFGFGLLLQLGVAVTVAVASEALVLRWQRRPVLSTLGDLSAVVSAGLLVLCLGPLVPLWCVALGAAFAILVVKQLFGGLGRNLFNPAMGAYVFLLLVFPAELVFWPTAAGVDATTAATPLAYMQDGLGGMATTAELFAAPDYARLEAQRFVWLSLAWLAGGSWLLWRRTITWQIPLAMLGGLFLAASVLYLYDNMRYPAPWFQLLMGGSLLGAFFVATDPASSPASPRGRLLYGLLIGVLVCGIRSFGNYADGVALAVLMMNAVVPLLDAWARPRVLGT